MGAGTCQVGPGGGVISFGGSSVPASTVNNIVGGQNGIFFKPIIIVYRHFANAGKDTSACYGIPVNLNATGGLNYSWSPATTLSNANTASITATPTNYPATYIITVTDAIGCTDMDTVLIRLITGSLFMRYLRTLWYVKGRKCS